MDWTKRELLNKKKFRDIFIPLINVTKNWILIILSIIKNVLQKPIIDHQTKVMIVQFNLNQYKSQKKLLHYFSTYKISRRELILTLLGTQFQVVNMLVLKLILFQEKKQSEYKSLCHNKKFIIIILTSRKYWNLIIKLQVRRKMIMIVKIQKKNKGGLPDIS